jgi:hypothetical protein
MAASIAIALPLSMMSLSWDLYNPDAVDLVRSSIDRSLGVPSTAIAWPAASIQIISQVVIAVLYLTGSHGLSLNSFVEFLARLHQNPSELLMPLRVTLALLNCLSPFFAFLTARHLGCATPIALLCAVGWALSPITMTYHFAGTSDGLAWALAQAGASDIALQYLQSRGISSSSAKVLWSALTEREQPLRARLVAIESVSDPAASPALFYSPSANSKQATLATNRSALVSLTDQEALSLFTAQPKDYTLLTDCVPDDGAIPFPPSAAWGSGEMQFRLFASDPANPGNGRFYRDRFD